MIQSSSILGLDIGEVRVGVARSSWPDGIPTALTTLTNGTELIPQLRQLIKSQNAVLVVAGRPRSLDGADTAQTGYTLELIKRLRRELPVTIEVQDEAVTSVNAEAELNSRRKPYSKSDIDSLSAVYILEDYISGQKTGAGRGER